MREAYSSLSTGSQAEIGRLAEQARRWQTETILQLRALLGRGPDTVADIGGGTGGALPILKAYGFRSVVNIDKSAEMLHHAERVAARLGMKIESVELDLLDADRLTPLVGRDLVAAISGFTVTHVGLVPICRAAARLLRRGGLLAVTDVDYGAMVVGGSPGLNHLKSDIQQLVIDHMAEFTAWEPVFTRWGFRTVMHSPTRLLLQGPHTLQPFSFVAAMKHCEEAIQLKAQLRALENSPQEMGRAKLTFTVHRLLLEKEVDR